VPGTGSRLDSVAPLVGVLAVIALGLSAGAMLAEGAVLVPYWRSLPPEAFLQWYAANAARLVEFFGPVEIAAAVLAIAAAALSGASRRRGSGLLALSAVLAVVILAFFPVYFQDVNASFAAGTIPLDQVPTELARWSALHWVRTAIGVGAFVAAVLGHSQAGERSRS